MDTTMGVVRSDRGPIRLGMGRFNEADPIGYEVGELYRALSKPLERVVRSDVHAPAQVIEDACQFAWARLVHHRGRVRRETAFGWLVKTALHEAFKLIRRAGREVSLEAELEAGRDRPDDRPGPLDLYERRERLETLGSLSARQQRLLWLYGLGLTYTEIAARDGCTPRTVERQLQRARATLRADDGADQPPTNRLMRTETGGTAPEERKRTAPDLSRPAALAPAPLGRAQLAGLDARLGARTGALA